MWRLLFVWSMVLIPGGVAAQSLEDQCGKPPPLVDERVVAEVDARLPILKKDIGLGASFESEKQEILSRYPNADEAILELTMLRMVCQVLMEDDEMSGAEKLEFLRDYRERVLGVERHGAVKKPSYWLPVGELRKASLEMEVVERPIKGKSVEGTICRGPESFLKYMDANYERMTSTAMPVDISPEEEANETLAGMVAYLDWQRRAAFKMAEDAIVLDQPMPFVRCYLDHDNPALPKELFKIETFPCAPQEIATDQRPKCAPETGKIVYQQIEKLPSRAICIAVVVWQDFDFRQLVALTAGKLDGWESNIGEGSGWTIHCLDPAGPNDEWPNAAVLMTVSDHRWTPANLMRWCLEKSKCMRYEIAPEFRNGGNHPRYGL